MTFCSSATVLLGDGSDVALPFPSLGLGECGFTLASVAANIQKHNVGSDRTDLFVPAIDHDPETHECSADSLVAGEVWHQRPCGGEVESRDVRYGDLLL